jgi:RNA polymerase-interacting CarD/CdnL/TRCF family regulator
VKLAVGTLVVYRGHGVGRITSVPAATADDGTVGLELDGMTVTLPANQAAVSLRALSTPAEIRAAGAILASSDGASSATWSTRHKAAQAKVASSELAELAEVVSEFAKRGRSRSNGATLSWQDKRLYDKARTILADEVAASRGTERAVGQAWIYEQLLLSDPTGG